MPLPSGLLAVSWLRPAETAEPSKSLALPRAAAVVGPPALLPAALVGASGLVVSVLRLRLQRVLGSALEHDPVLTVPLGIAEGQVRIGNLDIL